ncbi:LPS export ABC transporter periplasmic protein LptC [Pontibacter toksunensis]|uniref:LPS export ABC transporter periplasmic protein LptC n=1 Tax=Pontibacter toksunensis TaxID=1332631 RepID=A0ABW6BSM3_9BACT
MKAMRKAWIIGLMAMMAIAGFGCKDDLKDPDKEPKYTGPTVENHDVITLYSDSAKLLVKLQAPVQQEFETGDGVFPEGLYVEFFEQGVQGEQVTSTLKANYGKQDRNQNLFEVRGNVIVDNLKKQEKLETEELYWDRRKARIYTDKMVKITSPEEVVIGQGLEADQGFTNYRIRKVTGQFNLKE